MAVILVLLLVMNYECVVEMTSGGMIYAPSFMKIVKAVEGILRFCFLNLKGCNVCTTDGRNLGCAPLKWA
jgi:hypothetical protein